MTTAEQHKFFKDLDKRLWDAACKLLPSLDAAVYKHVVLGLVFLKYVGDSFEQRKYELLKNFTNPDHEYFLEDDEDPMEEIEERDYYVEENVFWVPESGRWVNLMDCAKLNPGEPLPWGDKTFKSVGALIDDAMTAVEKENPVLKNVLNKDYARLEVPDGKLSEVMDLINSIPFEHESLKSKDILGHVYEYFLGEFAAAEGKKGGQYYTPKSIVNLITEMLRPYKGRIYDPACGSGGFFVSSEEFVETHTHRPADLAIYGQESNPTTWRLAAMNMAIRGIEYDFGKEPADTFTNDQHGTMRFDYIMANPPFNLKGWGADSLANDVRWKYGLPPDNNANFAWMQHMIHHLSPKGKMGLLLANGSMSSATSGEGDIRRKIIEDDLVECIVALPGQLFTNTQIPACIWFLNKDKSNGQNIEDLRNRTGEVLFIDARNCGYMLDRVLRDFHPEKDIQRIAHTLLSWQVGEKSAVKYEDVPGFCAAVTLDDIRKHDYVLTPGRYVGAEEIEDNGPPFEEKMGELSTSLYEQMREGERLDKLIRENLAILGFGDE
ncbi:type I restriction-modification system subunit M [Maridesulfovibrio salexigens]|uniref:site-specific DNA-methyltransferase (adenine-specific) n=1 Tax=Maridesulfovibrio salexigens (strain ATCC 14822 / DSM 2638 / NCIMB 8403 / VKM B-1763) TaxID=526222 RepID=C6BZF2_MARSD|nr:class I SAM-dependent DNA methyltransferase [Maridesulfovibrio salexigens]ACS80789.1 Site-specific DNA-methyltransferase (adenine-specific) [Maridesulfovibrio salexigens DSM 2638]